MNIVGRLGDFHTAGGSTAPARFPGHLRGVGHFRIPSGGTTHYMRLRRPTGPASGVWSASLSAPDPLNGPQFPGADAGQEIGPLRTTERQDRAVRVGRVAHQRAVVRMRHFDTSAVSAAAALRPLVLRVPWVHADLPSPFRGVKRLLLLLATISCRPMSSGRHKRHLSTIANRRRTRFDQLGRDGFVQGGVPQPVE
jgi:hypothetical protein